MPKSYPELLLALMPTETYAARGSRAPRYGAENSTVDASLLRTYVPR